MAKFYCEVSGHGEDTKPTEARDFEEAAEKAAERDDSESAEYRCVGGEEVRVTVREESTGEVRVFKVWGEAVPSYNAEEVRDG